MSENKFSLEDCYYFLYSNCKLGQHCTYRHNILAKQCNLLCSTWSETKNCREDCPFRHSLYHLDKKRETDWCYWEVNGGCLKEQCVFMHRDSKKDAWKNLGIRELNEIRKEKNISLQNQKKTVSKEELEKFEAEKKKQRENKQVRGKKQFNINKVNIMQLKKAASHSLKGEKMIKVEKMIEELRERIVDIYKKIKSEKVVLENVEEKSSSDSELDQLLAEISE